MKRMSPSGGDPAQSDHVWAGCDAAALIIHDRLGSKRQTAQAWNHQPPALALAGWETDTPSCHSTPLAGIIRAT